MTVFINTDGGSRGNPGPSAIGFFVQDDQNQVINQLGEYIGETTNNEAEYQALLFSLRWLAEYDFPTPPAKIVWRLDSKLVVEQINKRWKIKEARLASWAQKCWELLATLPYSYQVIYVPREENKEADLLVNQALDAAK